jgi:nucleoside-diphosphate-sugar epimerase
MSNSLNFYRGEKVLVTGASGFIGSHLCRRLCAGDAEIHGVSRINSRQADANLRWWQGDLSDVDWVRHLLREVRPDIIFHLAGEVGGSRSMEWVGLTFRNGLLSTVNLLTVAAEVGCRRFVQAGSFEVPEPAEKEVIPCSPYAAAKFASSAYTRMFHSLYRLPAVVARMFMVYGPAQRDLQKLIPYVILSLLRGEAPRLSSGTRPVDWIYVEDIAEGLLLAGQVPGTEGMTIDLGTGHLVPVRAVVEHLVELMNSPVCPVFGAIPDRLMEPVRTADVKQTEATLRWKPAISLRDGLQKTVEWYERHFAALAGQLPVL